MVTSGGGFIIALAVIVFAIFSAGLSLLTLFLVGIRKRPRSTLLAVVIGFIGIIFVKNVQTSFIPFLFVIAGFIFGMFIFKEDKSKIFRGKKFSIVVRVMSIVTIVSGIFFSTSLLQYFLTTSPLYIKEMVISLIAPVISIIIGCLAFFFGSK